MAVTTRARAKRVGPTVAAKAVPKVTTVHRQHELVAQQKQKQKVRRGLRDNLSYDIDARERDASARAQLEAVN